MTGRQRDVSQTLAAERPLRILIENGEYWLRNNGDLAMLAATISRLRDRWPHARIAVLTEVPALLRAYFPGVEPISGFDNDPWAKHSWVELLAGRLGPRIVGPVALGRLRLRVWLARKARPILSKISRPLTLTSATNTTTPRDAARTKYVLPPGSAAAARKASLVVALGGGYLADVDPAQTVRALTLLEYASDQGVRVVLVGQGIGPLEDPALQRRAAEALPKMDFIGLREGRRGPEILRRAGVSSDRVLVTGDDAIELAYAARSESPGSGLGVCLRIAAYTPLRRSAHETVGRVVRRESTRYGARLVPLIISEHPSEDRPGTLPLVRGAGKVARPLPRYSHPAQVAQRVAVCRIVVTGAYHLAVFALSQGIPVVAMTSSRYYDDKFLGLADMFGVGLTLVRLDDVSLEHELTDGISRSWEQAASVREELRARARQQIDACREAFGRIFALTEEQVDPRVTVIRQPLPPHTNGQKSS
jgi:polysaccharide pyruvyl transferase WcaK-like protein